jgi:hypothetical protein
MRVRSLDIPELKRAFIVITEALLVETEQSDPGRPTAWPGRSRSWPAERHLWSPRLRQASRVAAGA